MMRMLFLILFALTVATSFSQSFQVGNKVEAFNSGAWYKGSIMEIGSGNYQGYYYVHYDQYSQGQWIKGTNIRLLKNSAATIATSPRNGLYTILSYGSPSNPIRIGYFRLNDGKYMYYDTGKKEIGSGNYSFDKGSKTITWKSGPFKNAKWNGTFEIAREGKTHKIRLNRVTTGSNSTDSK